jgi:fatty acid desaturase
MTPSRRGDRDPARQDRKATEGPAESPSADPGRAATTAAGRVRAAPPGTHEDSMNEASRNQGWAICAGAAIAALLFVVGLLTGSYWALAIPVAIITLFALGLVAWVGYTIATIQVEADAAPEVLTTDETATSDHDEPRKAEDAA